MPSVSGSAPMAAEAVERVVGVVGGGGKLLGI